MIGFTGSGIVVGTWALKCLPVATEAGCYQ